MAVRRIRASWWVDFRAGGIRYRRRSPCNTRPGAKEYEFVLRQRLARGEPVDGPKPEPTLPTTKTFGEFAREWFDTYVVTNNKPSEQYSKAKVLRVHLLPYFGGYALTEITAREVEAYKSVKLRAGLAAKTLYNHLTVIGKCLRTAVEWGVLDHAPLIRLPRTDPQRVDYLTPEELEKILADSAEPMWNALVRLAARTGMRDGELFGLAWEDVDLLRGIVTIRRAAWQGIIGTTKTGRTRHAPLMADARDALERLPRTGPLVFSRPDGSPLNYSTSKHALKRVARRTGVRHFGIYTLRHTFASHLVASGAPLPVVQQLMGHTSITMTMRYTHFAPAALENAVAALQRLMTSNGAALGQQAVSGAPEGASTGSVASGLPPGTPLHVTENRPW